MLSSSLGRQGLSVFKSSHDHKEQVWNISLFPNLSIITLDIYMSAFQIYSIQYMSAFQRNGRLADSSIDNGSSGNLVGYDALQKR